MATRKEVQEFIVKYVEKMCPSGDNRRIYTEFFDTLSDKDFKQWIDDLESGAKELMINAPNFKSNGLDVQRNLEIADSLGHNFFQRIMIPADGETPAYLTPIPYMVVDLPIRRQAQLLWKKIKIPEDSKTIDDLTGQPTGKSEGSGISYPETQVMAAMGLNNCLEEMLKFRGGDIKGFNAMNTMISRTGGVSLNSIRPYASGVTSTRTLKTFLTAAHLANTL